MSLYPSFNPSSDVAALNKPVTAKSVDEATIIDILTERKTSLHQQIKAAYLQEKGKVSRSGKFRYLISVIFVLNMDTESWSPSSFSL